MKIILERWQRYLNEDKSSHYHSFPAAQSEEIKQIIADNDETVVSSCRIPGNCQSESYAWAKVFRDGGIDVEIHHGMYKDEGHTWLVIDGYIFDPTARQFEDFPNMDEFEYSTHEIED